MNTFILRSLGFALCLFNFTACQFNYPVPTSGHYEGNLTYIQGDKTTHSMISAEISPIERGQATLQLTHLNGVQRPSIELNKIRSSSLEIDLPELDSQKHTLKREQACYVTSDQTNATLSIRLCPAEKYLLIEAFDQMHHPVMVLTLDHFPKREPLQLEPPQSFTLEEAMNRTLVMNFENQIEFHHVMQARHQARSAYLNLLPRLSANSVMTVIGGGTVLGSLTALSDLAPFLFPSRWIEAKQTDLLSEAEQDALIIMRGDTGVQAEGMAYLLARDFKTRDDLKEAIQQARKIQKRIEEGENSGIFPIGTSDMIAAMGLSIEADAHEYGLAIEEQLTHYAQALGFKNPRAVTTITVPESEIPIEKAVELHENELMETVLARSFELRQINFLIREARLGKTALYFNWMDPAADPSSGLGFGLGSVIAVQRSKISELLTIRQQLQANLLKELVDTVDVYNESLEDYERHHRILKIIQRRLERQLENLEYNRQLNTFDFISAFQDHIKTLIGIRTAEATYRMSLAKIHRMLLEGFYSKLHPDFNTPHLVESALEP